MMGGEFGENKLQLDLSGCNSKYDRLRSFIHGSGAAGARRLQIFGDGTPSSRFRQHAVEAWRLQSHF